MAKFGRVRIGVSGWRYAPWRGVFYPETLPQRLELQYASSIFPTLEINGSFYSLQDPACWRRWYADTPDDFVFAVKGPRFITHMLKLRGVEQPLANFLASGVLALGHKLGPILWQFPPLLRFDASRFEPFLELLPRDTEAALRLAWRRHRRMHGRSWLRIDQSRPLRYAMEVRHESFADVRFIELLRTHKVALVVAETAGKWPMLHDVTADFMYLRLHGDKTIYQSGYGSAALARWADAVRAWHRGEEPDSLPPGAMQVAVRTPRRVPRDVFCYFDNTDVKLRAPRDARSLMRKLGLSSGRWRGHAARSLIRRSTASGSRPRTSRPRARGTAPRRHAADRASRARRRSRH
jgi:uncharacterized protein YecE (DUF72 family)